MATTVWVKSRCLHCTRIFRKVEKQLNCAIANTVEDRQCYLPKLIVEDCILTCREMAAVMNCAKSTVQNMKNSVCCLLLQCRSCIISAFEKLPIHSSTIWRLIMFSLYTNISCWWMLVMETFCAVRKRVTTHTSHLDIRSNGIFMVSCWSSLVIQQNSIKFLPRCLISLATSSL